MSYFLSRDDGETFGPFDTSAEAITHGLELIAAGEDFDDHTDAAEATEMLKKLTTLDEASQLLLKGDWLVFEMNPVVGELKSFFGDSLHTPEKV